MKLSIVLAGDGGSELLAGLQRLVPVVGHLEDAGVTVETSVVGYAGDPGVDAMTAAVEGASFVRPAVADGTILERWRAGADTATGDVLWLVGADATYDADRLTDHLALLEKTVQVVYDDCQMVIRRAAVTLLDVEPELTPTWGSSAENAVSAIVEQAKRRRLRAVPVPLALPARPFHQGDGGPGLFTRSWQGATIYEGAPGAVTFGRHGGADVGSVIRSWAPHQQVTIGNFSYLSAGVLLSNPSDGVGPADRVGPTGLRPTFGHNVNLPTIGLMFAHVPAIGHRYVGGVRPSPLVIGHDVWLGSRATVVGDVTIGNGAIIAAGAVVMGDVPPYAVVEGNPGKVVRMRFSPGVVESLLRINWWDWDDETIAARADWFTRPVADFCNRFDPVRVAALLGAPSEDPVPQPV